MCSKKYLNLSLIFLNEFLIELIVLYTKIPTEYIIIHIGVKLMLLKYINILQGLFYYVFILTSMS